MINPVFLILIPLLIAFVTMILKKKKRFLLILGAALNAIASVSIIKGETIIGGFKPPYGIDLVVDEYSHIGVILINVLFLAGILISSDTGKKFTPVLLTAIAGLNGIILTGDLFNLFVFLEVTTISAYILSTSTKKYRHSFNYLVLGSVGAVFYLLGIIILYSMTGSLNMSDISIKAMELSDKQLFIPILLIFVGIAVELKLMPVSGWVKGVYSNSDRLTGALFSSVFAAGILFAFGRIFVDVVSISNELKTIIIVIAAITFALGELSAFKQVRIKKILMFSSVAQSGLAVALLMNGIVFPAIILVINNAIGKMVMFSTAGAMEEKYGTDDYSNLKGVFLKNVITGISFSISGLSIIGLPFFLGFYGKISSLAGLFEKEDYILPALILLVTIVEGAYFIKLLISLWAPGDEGQESREEYAVKPIGLFNLGKAIVVFILALIILAAGILPSLFGDLISKDHKFLDESGIVFDISSVKGENK